MASIWQLLEALPAHFARVARSDAAAQQAWQAAGQLLKLAIDQRSSGGQQNKILER